MTDQQQTADLKQIADALGLSTEEVAERMFESMAERAASKLAREMDVAAIDNRIQEAVDAAVARIAEEEISPRVEALVEGATLQKTTRWGDKVGEAKTFREYLVYRFEEWMTEEVKFDGNRARGAYRSDVRQARVAHMVDRHLHYEIQNAVEEALKKLNSTVAKGLADTVKIQLKSALDRLNVSTSIRK